MPYDLINEAAELMNWHIDSNGKMDVCPRECPLPEDTRPLCTECTYKTVLHRIAALVDVVDLRACMVEARHKLGLEQDKNDELRAVAQEVLSYTDYIRPLGPRGQVLRNAALAALDEEVGDRNDIDQICRDNSAAVEEMMAANRGGGGVSNQKMCPLLAAGVMASPSDRIAEKIQAGWDRCIETGCAWWDEARGECAMVPKWATLTTEEMGE